MSGVPVTAGALQISSREKLSFVQVKAGSGDFASAVEYGSCRFRERSFLLTKKKLMNLSLVSGCLLKGSLL